MSFEVAMMQDLGPKIVFNKPLGATMSISTLRSEGYEGIFLGIGLPMPKATPIFEGLTIEQVPTPLL